MKEMLLPYSKDAHGRTRNKNSSNICTTYVDDTYCTVKIDSVNEILLKLKSFHIKMQFTYETKSHNLLPFLDVLVMRNSVTT